MLLVVKELKKYFPLRKGILQRKSVDIRAVDGVTFEVARGKTIALVGESGSGKTTIGRTIVRLYEPTSGHVIFKGVDLTGLSEREFKPYRTDLQMVFQDPTSSLNPRRRIKDMLLDPLRINRIGIKGERLEKVNKLLETVGLRSDVLDCYPYMLSGGQRQRVAIARAIIANPDLIVLDEPTSSLDVSIQARIINLLKHLQVAFNLTYIFISHDIALVRNFVDEVVIMYLGRVMEKGNVLELFSNPCHPYTIALMSETPTVEQKDTLKLWHRIKLYGQIPSQSKKPRGCRFKTRCPFAKPICEEVEPDLVNKGSRSVRCHLFANEFNPD